MTPMALSSEPTDRSRTAARMSAVVAFVTGLALIVAGLDVALASPDSAQVLRRPGIVVGAADNVHHINAAATEVVIKAPPSCRKHACRATLSKPTRIVVLIVNVLAGQGQRTTVICIEFASGPAVAGGDPVNGSDPSGDIASPQQAEDMCLPNPATGAYGNDVCIGQVGMAACVDAVSARFPVNEPGGGNLAADLCSGSFDGVAPGASWDNLVENYDPVFGVLYWTQQAWDTAQDPCSSNWAILEDSLNAFNSADATLLVGLGGTEAGGFAAEGGTGFLETLGPFDDAGAINIGKFAARQTLSGFGLPEEQFAAANSAIARATASTDISVELQGSNVIVRLTRPGFDGYQVVESIVGPDGSKSVVQLAYNSEGQLVHYDPKTP
jgi:hypothetical protein